VIVNDGDIMRFFQDADTDRNNYVSKVEFRMVMQKIGFKGTMELQEAELANVFSLFDEDRDGRISYSELCK
jgi:Ca2+-binding EF-hand superfamily protein